MWCDLQKSILVYWRKWTNKKTGLNASIGAILTNLKVAKVVGCTITKMPDLPFEFTFGSCITYKLPQEKVLMCFHVYDQRKCHW